MLCPCQCSFYCPLNSTIIRLSARLLSTSAAALTNIGVTTKQLCEFEDKRYEYRGIEEAIPLVGLPSP